MDSARLFPLCGGSEASLWNIRHRTRRLPIACGGAGGAAGSAQRPGGGGSSALAPRLRVISTELSQRPCFQPMAGSRPARVKPCAACRPMLAWLAESPITATNSSPVSGFFKFYVLAGQGIHRQLDAGLYVLFEPRRTGLELVDAWPQVGEGVKAIGTGSGFVHCSRVHGGECHLDLRNRRTRGVCNRPAKRCIRALPSEQTGKEQREQNQKPQGPNPPLFHLKPPLDLRPTREAARVETRKPIRRCREFWESLALFRLVLATIYGRRSIALI